MLDAVGKTDVIRTEKTTVYLITGKLWWPLAGEVALGGVT